MFNQAGVEETKTQTFRFDPTYERIYVNRMEVIDSDGKTVSSADVDDCYVTTSNGALATTESILHVPVPGLKAGHTLHFAVTIEDRADSDEFAYENFLFASAGLPARRAVFLRGDVASVHSEERTDMVTRKEGEDYAYWLVSSPPRFYLEMLQPTFEDFLPVLSLGSREGDWKALAKEYLETIADRIPPSSDAKAKAKSLTSGLDNDAEKTTAILAWVRDELTYQGIEFGTRARIPNRTPDVIDNRYGDCKDHSLLAHQVLAAAGIESHLTLVNTGASLREALPSLDQFDHMILYVPSGDGGNFYDATSKNLHLPDAASASLAGQRALVLDPDEPRLIEIEAPPIEKSLVRSEREVSLAEDSDDLIVSETMTFGGIYGGWVRGYLRSTNAADHRSNLQRMLGEDSRFRLETIAIEQLEDFAVPLVIKTNYRLVRALRNDGRVRSGKLPSVWERYYFATGSTAERKTPFEISLPLVFESQVRFQGAGAKLEGIWSKREISSPWVKFEQKPSVEDGNAVLESRVQTLRGTHPPGNFADYQSDLESVLEALGGRIEIPVAAD